MSSEEEKNFNPWVTYIIYYNREDWNNLLNLFIDVTVKELLISKIIKSYYLFLGEEKGDHIIFCLKIKQNKDAINSKISAECSRFLKYYPSCSYEYIISGLFKNFDNNTYITPKIKFQGSANFYNSYIEEFRCLVSKILLINLKDERFSLGNVYILLIYLEFSVISSMFPKIEDANRNLKSFFESDISSSQQQQNLLNILNNNNELFSQIICDVWQANQSDSDLYWIDTLKNSCVVFFAKTKFYDSFLLLSRIIFEHLGLKFKKNDLVFLSKALKGYLNS